MNVKRILAIASLALLFDVAAIGQQPVRAAEKRLSANLGTAQLIVNLLAKARVSGSLEYNGKCGADVLIPDLPPIREPETPYARNPAVTLRFMFSVDPRMVVSQESNGTIRVVEAGLQTDILRVRINHLSFSKISDPEQALNVVLSAPEVQSFIQTHGIGQPVNPWTAPFYALPGVNMNTAPVPGVPSVSGELNDVTLADALDYLLKTFPGYWLYQDCSLDGQRIVHFDLFPAPGRMWSWGNGQTWVK